MKKLLIVFIFVSTKLFGQCSDEPFPTINLSMTTKPGFVFEVGAWGTNERRIGGFGGFEVSRMWAIDEEKDTKSLYYQIIFFTKGQYRINRYVHVTGLVGIMELEKIVYGVGIRSSIPLSGGFAAILIEPMYRTDGMRINAGVGLALDRGRRPIE